MNKKQPQQPGPLQDTDSSEEYNLERLLDVLLNGRWIIILLTSLFAVAGLLHAMFATPVYKADALLQIEEQVSPLTSFTDLTQEASSITEIEILKSRMVIGRVVDELNLDIIARPLYFPVIGRGLMRMFGPKGSDLMSSLFPGYAWGDELIRVPRLVLPDSLPGASLTLVAGENQHYRLYKNDRLLLSGKTGELSEGSGIQILVTDLIADPGVKFIVNRQSRLGVTRSLQRKLAVVEKGQRSGVLLASLEGENREKTHKILDSISRHYVMQNVQRLSAEAEKGLDFLNARLPEVKAKLIASEQVLSDFRLRNRSVDLSLETESLLGQLVNLDAQLNELTFVEAELRKGFTKAHPSYIALMRKRKILNEQKQVLEEYVQTLPKTQQDMLHHSRDVEINQGIYLQLLNRINELGMVKAGTVGNVRILDNAEVMPSPVKPRKRRIVFMAAILGLMVGVGTVFLRVALRRGVEGTDEIEASGLPVYVTVPFSEKQQEINRKPAVQEADTASGESRLLAVRANDDLSIEAIRSLRTSMHFVMMESSSKVLMITGPNQNIGKSFIAANLAAVYAQMGQKVLLIDADMRKGHTQKLFNLPQSGGLSEYLSSQVERDRVIKAVEPEGLHFLSCGSTPPNPSELLMSPKFGELAAWARGEYGLIVVDTPPVLAVTDAAIIGQFADISMIVVRFGQTTVKEVEATRYRCSQNSVSIRGCILNGIVKKSGYGSYGYYGYYDYGHGKKRA